MGEDGIYNDVLNGIYKIENDKGRAKKVYTFTDINTYAIDNFSHRMCRSHVISYIDDKWNIYPENSDKGTYISDNHLSNFEKITKICENEGNDLLDSFFIIFDDSDDY